MKPLRVNRQALLLPFLLERLANRKPSEVKRLLRFGSVRVNGAIVTLHRQGLKPGDVVDFLTKEAARGERIKTALPFGILHEDADVIVVDKPSGLLTMATDREKEKTLYWEITEYAKRSSPDGRGRVFVVHRLDRDTSGLVVFAKHPKAKHFLQENWGNAVKRYYAVVEGTPRPASGEMRSRLVESESGRVYSVDGPTEGAKIAVTRYSVIESKGGHSLLDVELLTGRKNQIRVQLSDHGHPVVGDMKYGAATDPIDRLGLHAYFLEFPHPADGRPLAFKTPAPKEFIRLLKS